MYRVRYHVESAVYPTIAKAMMHSNRFQQHSFYGHHHRHHHHHQNCLSSISSFIQGASKYALQVTPSIPNAHTIAVYQTGICLNKINNVNMHIVYATFRSEQVVHVCLSVCLLRFQMAYVTAQGANSSSNHILSSDGIYYTIQFNFAMHHTRRV